MIDRKEMNVNRFHYCYTGLNERRRRDIQRIR